MSLGSPQALKPTIGEAENSGVLCKILRPCRCPRRAVVCLRMAVANKGVVRDPDRMKAESMESAADLPTRLPPGDRVLPRMLRRQAALYGDRKLVEIGTNVWSFRDA